MLQKRMDIEESPIVTPLNIEPLLDPISEERPSGEDLRYAQVVDRIKEARRADDQLEQGEWRSDIKTSDWRQIAKLSSRVLAEERVRICRSPYGWSKRGCTCMGLPVSAPVSI